MPALYLYTSAKARQRYEASISGSNPKAVHSHLQIIEREDYVLMRATKYA